MKKKFAEIAALFHLLTCQSLFFVIITKVKESKIVNEE